MPVKLVAGKRKPPQQQRSAAMVERIVDAGARVLLGYGYDATSTNKIAAEAGISPGSLYYYFADKDDVLRSVLDRFLALLNTTLSSTTARLDRVDRSVFQHAADHVIGVLEENRRLLDTVVNEAPHLVRAETRHGVEERLHEHMRTAFVLLKSPLLGADLEAACWLASQLCLTVPVRYVLSEPAIRRSAVIDGLADQIATLARIPRPTAQ
ncbi:MULTISPECIES: TetR/AcrR family transcriptional regulator [unclassified Mycobacterium]|uniref:TetR/AcrR family transcriptional regulator n=1 Tax=unclassified Mycobacterium TaxID=2642494 RepID=UPI0029C87E97|nr:MULTISPECIES: TetR/AcrR family transcriptional regulator [unclassified Mycobacterium]